MFNIGLQALTKSTVSAGGRRLLNNALRSQTAVTGRASVIGFGGVADGALTTVTGEAIARGFGTSAFRRAGADDDLPGGTIRCRSRFCHSDEERKMLMAKTWTGKPLGADDAAAMAANRLYEWKCAARGKLVGQEQTCDANGCGADGGGLTEKAFAAVPHAPLSTAPKPNHVRPSSSDKTIGVEQKLLLLPPPTIAEKKKTAATEKKETAAAEKKETTAAEKKETAAANKKETAAAGKKETAAADKKETAAVDKKETAAADKKETAAADKKETAAADKKETAAAKTVRSAGVDVDAEKFGGTPGRRRPKTDEPTKTGDGSPPSDPKQQPAMATYLDAVRKRVASSAQKCKSFVDKMLGN